MASIVLGAAGSALGASIPVVGPLIGSAVGGAVGSVVGGFIDDAIFGVPTRSVEGPRLADLSVQVSTYGKTIPIVYGNMRIAGNVIWSQPIKETATSTTTSSGGGKGVGGGGTQTTRTNYSYSVSLAIAICEGEIQGLVRAWADAKLLDLSLGTYRVYKGDEAQLPDPLMEAIEGVGCVPAYRGMAYVVIEDFPLADFGNRIPNFTFEVKRPLRTPDYMGQSTEEMVTGMTIIPGAGEFVYDTVEQVKVQGEPVGAGFAQTAFQTTINRHTPNGVTNAIAALDQLQETCPNLEWVSLVITWFGDNVDAGLCTIQPGVEFKDGAATQPDTWNVGSFTRDTARQITLIDGTPRYGGTPDDESVLRYIDLIRSRGLKVMVYPMFFMDVDGKPWRGRVTGSPSDVASFFTKPLGFNGFVTHYANLTKDRADAFVIGSELIGLTKVTDTPGNYPAVNELVALAATVKGVMGGNTLVTYAADWSEYHHTDGGWYNLDPLWASPHIDFIGIDAYFPLTDAPQGTLGYDIQTVIDGWDSGEGYTFFYSDPERTVQSPLSPAYAWKNLDWFWNNVHVNPDSNQTGWVPQSKKIWFTEYGFPSVDGATNRPNVFYDPESVESFFPHFSRGIIDFRAQRTGITATEARWQGDAMLERLFLWTWDARPFPYFPDLTNVWADGDAWAPGHWVSGKFGVSGLAAIVRDLCLRAGLVDAQIDVSRLTEQVAGYVITRQGSARQRIEELMAAYFFDAVESGTELKFIPRGNAPMATITDVKLVRERDDAEVLSKTRQQEVELPQLAEVVYLDRIRQYQAGTQRATRQATESRQKRLLNLPIVLSGAEAHAIAEKHLYTQWKGRVQYRFMLDDAQAALEPTDVVTLEENGVTQEVRITRTLRDSGRMQVEAVADDVALYETSNFIDDAGNVTEAVPLQSVTALNLFDLPALPQDAPTEARMRLAAVGLADGWDGAAIYRADSSGEFQRLIDVAQPAAMGTVTVAPGAMAGNVLDEVSTLEVILLGEGMLQSVTLEAMLNGANAALVGDEVLQFREALELSAGKYRLSGLLRGRLGTENAIAGHTVGESFVLLNEALVGVPVSPDLFGLARDYKPVTFGATLGATTAQSFTYTAQALVPYAPVHVVVSGALGSDMTLSWVRRDRLYGQWRDGVDAGLAETVEAYEIEIYVNEVLMRTLVASSPSAIYTALMQSTDGAMAGDTLRFEVFQMSALVGPGKAGSVTKLL